MNLCLSGETRTQLLYSCTCFSFIIMHAAHCVDFTQIDTRAVEDRHVDVVLEMQLMANCHTTCILAGDRFALILFLRPRQRSSTAKRWLGALWSI